MSRTGRQSSAGREVGLALLFVCLWVAPACAWRQQLVNGGEVFAVAVDPSGDVHAVGRLLPTGEVAARFAGATGAILWQSPVVLANGASDVAPDGSGNVVVTGSVFSSPFSVVEMAGGTGAEVWRYEPVGPGGADAVAVDAAGDVIASGSIQFDFTVVKLDDVTGAELWRTDLQGTAGGGLADAVAVDGAGDVVAAGHVANTGTPSDLAVVKLDGTTGAELWRYEVNGSHLTSTDDAAAVVLDTSGDAFVAGGTSNDSGTFFVARVDGTNGMEVWRAEIADGRARAIALDATGGLIAGGHLSDSYAVVRLDPADGSEIWRYTEIGLSGVDAVAVDASGAVSAGHRRIGPDDIIVVSHALADGSAVWRQDLGDNGTPHDVELDAAGDVAVGAYNDGFYVAKLSRLDGVVGPVAGTSLTVRDRAGDPSARQVRVSARDSTIVAPPPASAGDPTLGGATLEIFNPTTLETATLTLPSGAWTGRGTPPGAKGYQYGDPAGTNGPCQSALVAPRKLRARCLGQLGNIPFSLDEPTQGSLVVSVTLGAAEPQCMTFGGVIGKDAGTANPGPSGTFRARRAAAASGSCP